MFDYKSEYRRYKIAKVLGKKYDYEEFLLLHNFAKKHYTGLTIVEKKTETTYSNTNNKQVIYHHHASNHIWVCSDMTDLTYILLDKYKYRHMEIVNTIKSILKTYLNINSINGIFY